MLVKFGADVDATDRNGRTAAMHAAMNGQENLARMLLVLSQEPDAADFEGVTVERHIALHAELRTLDAALKDITGETVLRHDQS